ncbi:MAG: uncharacterized radical-SAM protein SSO2309 [Metallosphaera javensis (ex Sakai et al. 2022)]|nr:MAG: uncharacterized radical-SAM protein SSO2309 [Metallosphaera javensis (ex Sakai et al. 2022)]
MKERAKSVSEYHDHLFVFVDGIADVHDKIRGIPGSFERAIEGIKEARRYLSILISFTLTKENTDQVKDVIELSRKLNVGISIQVEYDYTASEKLSPDKMKLYEALKLIIELKKRGYPIVDHWITSRP